MLLGLLCARSEALPALSEPCWYFYTLIACFSSLKQSFRRPSGEYLLAVGSFSPRGAVWGCAPGVAEQHRAAAVHLRPLALID